MDPNIQGMFSRAENILITGGTFIANDVSPPTSDLNGDWLKLLRSHTSTGAFHNSDERYDPPKCHPRTREVVLKEIMDWVQSHDTSEQILWIYGPAGSGKSSIAQTIAELCEELGILASDFFFSRTAIGRNTHNNLISTLACQHTSSIPEIRVHLSAAINSDTLIFSRSLQTQLEMLILKPYAALSSPNNARIRLRHNPYPYLIIIDGLDECGTPENQRYILTSLSSALQKSSTPFIFIIASRPEQAIRGVFNGTLNPRTRRIVLDDKYEPDEDITLFLNSKFANIKQEHPLASILPEDWPSTTDVDSLVQKASGQFIYASTVMKYIESAGSRPTNALKIVLNLSLSGTQTPFADLDALYRHILTSVENEKLEKALIIFSLLFAMSAYPSDIGFNPVEVQTPEFMEEFLGYEAGEISIILGDLHSIVYVPSPSTFYLQEEMLRLFHASLGDFLQDKARSGDLFLDMGLHCAKFARVCIDHLTTWLLHEDLLSTPAPEMRYELSSADAIRFSYLSFPRIFSTVHLDENLVEILYQFPIEKFMQRTLPTNRMAKVQMLCDIPCLFDWIQRQKNGTEVYNTYTAHFDAFVKSQMILDSTSPITRHPEWQRILTALTLNHDTKSDHLVDLCMILETDFFDHDPMQYSLVDHLFLITLGDIELIPKDTVYYFSRLSKILTDSAPQHDTGKYYHVDISSYIDLALEVFDRVTGEQAMPRMLDTPTLGRRKIAFTQLFFGVLSKIPGERKVGEYLRANRHRDYIEELRDYESELRSCVDAYIKDCSLEGGGSSSVQIPPVVGVYGTTALSGTTSRASSTHLFDKSGNDSITNDLQGSPPSTMHVQAAIHSATTVTEGLVQAMAKTEMKPAKKRGLLRRGKNFIKEKLANSRPD